MSPRHLHRYAAAFEGRYNDRASSPFERMVHVVEGMEGRRLTYWELTSSSSASSSSRTDVS